MIRWIVVTAASLALSAGVAAAQQPATAKAEFVNMAGEGIGSAKLTGTKGGVLIEAEAKGLPAGEWVGFHVHETGKCDAAGKHESAGGHFNPGGREHGYLAANGPHAGDMPNLLVAADGSVHVQVFNAAITLDEAENGVIGRALMIHGGADDYQSQPSGKAGARYACAVIVKE